MLAVDGLSAGYSGAAVIENVTLGCGRGEIVCLLGRNGVGKSTTLKSVMGLLRSAGGDIRFEDQSIAGLPPFAIAQRGIGYVPEERLIFPNLTVAENLSMGVWKGIRQPARSTFDRVLDLFPRLADKRQQRGRTLSGGEQQMLAIGRSLMGEPRLLLVDEPTEGLAPVIVQALERALKALAAGGTAVLVVESKLAVARRIADRIVVMAKGRTVFDGASDELDRDAETRRRYLEV